MGGLGNVGRVAFPVSALANGGFGGGKGSRPPSVPDFAGMAERQADSGRINQENPFGSTSWGVGPDGRPTQTTALAGGLGQGAQNLMGQIGNQGPLGTGDDARQAATGAYYDRAVSRLDPQWQAESNAFRAQMAGQGLDPGSEAYDRAFGNFSRGRNDAYATAEREAQTAGLGAQSLTFNQNLQSQMAPYQQLGALGGLMGGLSGQGPQTQYLPAAMQAYEGGLQRYGIDQAGKNSALNGMGQLGSNAAMLAMFSDERLKTDVHRFSVEAIPGVPFARWKWKSDGKLGFGVIAQDLEKVRPDLVHYDARGYRMVDYSFLGG